MNETLKDIITTCEKLTRRPQDDSLESRKERTEKLRLDKKEHHWVCIINEMQGAYSYLRFEPEVSVMIYNTLSLLPTEPLKEIDDKIFENFDAKRQIVDDGKWRHYLTMQIWDIEISPLRHSHHGEHSNESMQNWWIIIKWQECFIHQERWDYDTLIMATQNNLEEILKWLTELL